MTDSSNKENIPPTTFNNNRFKYAPTMIDNDHKKFDQNINCQKLKNQNYLLYGKSRAKKEKSRKFNGEVK